MDDRELRRRLEEAIRTGEHGLAAYYRRCLAR